MDANTQWFGQQAGQSNLLNYLICIYSLYTDIHATWNKCWTMKFLKYKKNSTSNLKNLSKNTFVCEESCFCYWTLHIDGVLELKASLHREALYCTKLTDNTAAKL